MIWHNPDEIPDFNKSYVELSRSVQGDLVYSTWGHPNYITKNTIKWCYMDDLLALETELSKTKRALDIAIHRLNQIAEHDCNQGCMYVAQNALEQITETKEKTNEITRN